MTRFWRIACCFFFLAKLLAISQQPKAPSTGFQIAGTVVDSGSRQPLAGTHVSIAPVAQLDQPLVMVTNETGHFNFEGVRAGKYMLTAHHQGYLNQAYDQHYEFSTAIVVGPGVDPGDIVFTLQPECSISGKVTDEHGEPVRDGMIARLQGSGGESFRTATSDDEGSFRFAHLQPGKYVLQVTAEPWYRQYAVRDAKVAAPSLSASQGPQTPRAYATSFLDVLYPITYYPNSTDPAGATPIVVSPGDHFVADISLRPIPALHLSMPLPGGTRGDGLIVDIAQQSSGQTGFAYASNTTPQGTIELNGLAPGHYQILLRPTEANDGHDAKPIRMDLEIAPDGGVQTSPMPAGAEVKGTARLDNGASLAAPTKVILTNRKTGQDIEGDITQEGKIAFSGAVPAGTYDVDVPINDGLRVQSLTATGANATGLTLQIGDDSTLTLGLTLTYATAEVAGIAEKEGTGFAGAMMSVAS